MAIWWLTLMGLAALRGDAIGRSAMRAASPRRYFHVPSLVWPWMWQAVQPLLEPPETSPVQTEDGAEQGGGWRVRIAETRVAAGAGSPRRWHRAVSPEAPSLRLGSGRSVRSRRWRVPQAPGACSRERTGEKEDGTLYPVPCKRTGVKEDGVPVASA